MCIIGLGTVGYPTALHIKHCGFNTFGYDVNEAKTKLISSFPAFYNWKDVPKAEVYVLCVSTSWRKGRPNASNIYDVCHKIVNKGGKPLVCIESTVPMGTCRKASELFDKVYLVHVPHRYWVEKPLEHGVKQLRVIGALDKLSLTKGKKFYSALSIPLHITPSLEIAEIIKIAENAYRFVQIAFVEDLQMICNEADISFEGVRRGANTKWNVNLLEARGGVGGTCLPKDVKYLKHISARSFLLEGAIKTDQKI